MKLTIQRDHGIFTQSHIQHYTKDNHTTLYGKTPQSCITDPNHPGHIFSWLICESIDNKGNAISYEYQEETDTGVDHSQANERNRQHTANNGH